MSKLRRMGTHVGEPLNTEQGPTVLDEGKQNQTKVEVKKTPLRLASKVEKAPISPEVSNDGGAPSNNPETLDLPENPLIIYCPFCKETNAKTSTHCWKCDKPLYKGAKRKKVKKERNISYKKVFFIALVPLLTATFILGYPIGGKLSKYHQWRIKSINNELSNSGTKLTEEFLGGTWVGYIGHPDIYSYWDSGFFHSGKMRGADQHQLVLNVHKTNGKLIAKDFQRLPAGSRKDRESKFMLMPYLLDYLGDEVSIDGRYAFAGNYVFEQLIDQPGVILAHFVHMPFPNEAYAVFTTPLYKVSDSPSFDIDYIRGEKDWLKFVDFVRGERPKVTIERDSKYHGYMLGASLVEKSLKGGQKVLITEVVKGRFADQSGIKRNDVILQVNDKAVESIVDIQSEFAHTQEGERIKIVVQRKGILKTMNLIPEKPLYRCSCIKYLDDVEFIEPIEVFVN